MSNKRNYVLLITYIVFISILVVGALLIAKIAYGYLAPQYHYVVKTILYTFLISLLLVVIIIKIIRNDINNTKK